jgi:cysteinyl-tRNA synthetase
MALHLTNTLSGKKELFKPLGDTVKIYICGMTVQGPPHFGHMRAYITSDILIRYLKFLGYKMKVIQNFTDIDDKVIEKSLEEKIDYRVIAEKHIQEYYEVADKMNIRRADIYPKATQHIQEIIELIQKLINKGYAYESGGDIYFAVDKFSDYGKLSKKKLDDLIAGARVEVRTQKKNPADFALWKASKPNEPYWESPWGQGRPGWAIECSAMSMHYLGETLDLHLGGEDLIFPHHENEIAQSEAATGKPFVRYWIHNSMLNLTGEKMSKSTKHFITAKELLDKYAPNVLRLYFLKSHYRSPQEFDFKILDANKEAWTRIHDFLKTAITELDEHILQSENKVGNLNAHGTEISSRSPKTINTYKEAMDDDLNTPKAIAIIFNRIKDGFDAIQAKKTAELKEIYLEVLFYLNNLGFSMEEYNSEYGDYVLKTMASFNGPIKDMTSLEKAVSIANTKGYYQQAWFLKIAFQQKDINLLACLRYEFRNKREFDIADLIRKGSEEMGYILEDTDDGKGIRIKRKS